MKKMTVVAVMALVWLMAGAHVGSAQTTETFLLIPGVPGDSTDAKHARWIEVVSLSQSLVPVTERRRQGFSCDMTVLKSLDSAGPVLWGAAIDGQIFPEMRIEVQTVGQGAPLLYTLRLEGVRVTGVQTIVDDVNAPVEQLRLVPQSAALEYLPQKVGGTAPPAVVRTLTCGL
ncbi:MAG: type VI secretion system tube protein Hcp [Vicinamibacterales bacterium]